MKKKPTREVLMGLIILFTVILPVIAVAVGVFLFKQIPLKYMIYKEAEKLESRLMVTPEEKVVKPSEILAKKGKYDDKYLTVRGKVQPEPVVCERKICPESDPCCGCREKKNLVMSDADAPFLADSPGRLPIFAPEKEPICTRPYGSCDYDCQDWKLGKVYDAKGTFYAEAPIAGSGISLWEFYFEVEDKTQVAEVKAVSWPQRFMDNAKEVIKFLRTSGYYVR